MDYEAFLVRKKALELAVSTSRDVALMGENDIVAVAKVFEAYLKGEQKEDAK